MRIDARDNGATGTDLKLSQRSLPRRLAGAAILAALAALPLAPQRAEAGPTLLMDLDSGRVLHQSGAFVRWYPASLTKLMTAYVVLKAVQGGRLRFETPIPISEFALSQPPSKMGFPVGTQVTVGDALKMLMVHSANDIAVALAEGLSGSAPAFVDEMNVTAARLGMTDTRFANPNGLPDPGQLQMTTARDLALLARALRKEFPDQAGLFDIRAIRIAGRVMRNHNHLIVRYPGVDGMKTGYICSAGYNVVASATRGSRHLVAVVLGARSGHQRSEVAATLFEDGFARPFFDLSGERIEALPRPAAASAEPVDMKPILCSGRRRGKKAPPLPPEPVPFDARINVEVGRQALARIASGEAPAVLTAQVAAQAAVPPIQVSAVIPANAVQPDVPAEVVAEDEAKRPAVASAFSAPKLPAAVASRLRRPAAAKADATGTKPSSKPVALKSENDGKRAAGAARPKPAAKHKPAKKEEAKS